MKIRLPASEKLLSLVVFPESMEDVVKIDGFNVIVGESIALAVAESRIWIGKIVDDMFTVYSSYSVDELDESQPLQIRCIDGVVVFESPDAVTLFSKHSFNVDFDANKVKIIKIPLEGCYVYVIEAKGRINAFKEGLRDVFTLVDSNEKFAKFLRYIEKLVS